MNHREENTLKELTARVQILEQENSMLIERAEDFLLLGLITEAIHAETEVSDMFASALEKIALLKGIDLAAVCQNRNERWLVVSSYDGHAEQSRNGLLLGAFDALVSENPTGFARVSGVACQDLLGAEYDQISDILLLPFEAQIFGAGYLLLAVSHGAGNILESCLDLFRRALEVLVMNVSNRLLFQNYQVANEALGEKVSQQGRALVSSEERFRTVIDRAHEGFFLFDAQGICLQVNQRACETLGYEKDELLQLKVTDYDATLDAEKLALFYAGFEHNDHQQLRTLHQHKDGHRFPVEVNVSRVKLGEDYFYLALARDISSQVAAEELQLKLDLLLDSVPDIVFMADLHGQILYLNLTGRSLFNLSDPVKNKLSIFDLMSPQNAQRCLDEILPFAVEHGNWVGESALRVSEQETIPTLRTIVAPKNKLGVVENIFCFDRDLRELRQLEEQFVHAQKMEAIGTVVGGIAHDFNNLLAGIMGNVFMLLRKNTDENQRDRLKTMQQMCQNAAGMITQLLVFARKDHVQIVPLPLKRFMADFGKMYQVLVPENVDIELGDIAEDLIALTDLPQFQQILVNLLTNARDALEGRENPTIGISIEAFQADPAFRTTHPALQQSELVCVTVTDNGCGMLPEVRGKIFEPFFSTKAVNRGTGLGLAMVYGAIKRQNGAIQISSYAGQGTIVRIYLPRSLENVASEIAEVAPQLVYGRGELLILADDDAFVRESHKDALVQLGYRVIPVADGQQALDVYQANQQVALVISDIVMPTLDGLVAARMMRKINNDLPLLFMTGYADRAESAAELPAGAAIIKKPADIEQLSQKVAFLLKR